jgi:hypothetical protein
MAVGLAAVVVVFAFAVVYVEIPIAWLAFAMLVALSIVPERRR